MANTSKSSPHAKMPIPEPKAKTATSSPHANMPMPEPQTKTSPNLEPKPKTNDDLRNVKGFPPCFNCGTTLLKPHDMYVVNKEDGVVTQTSVCANCLVGHDVAVLRSYDNEKWCFGEVMEFDASKLLPFRMSFLDDVEEWVHVTSSPSQDYLNAIGISVPQRTSEIMDSESIGSFSSSSFSTMSAFDGGEAEPIFDDANLLHIDSFSSEDFEVPSLPRSSDRRVTKALKSKKVPAHGPIVKAKMTAHSHRSPMMWTAGEDQNLERTVKLFASNKWALKWQEVSKHCGDRSGKQCRERWTNHLSLTLKTEAWSPREDASLFTNFFRYGKSWCKISKLLTGRTDNGTKNRFHHLRRRLGKDYHRQEQKYSNIMVDKPVESTDVDSVEAIQEKTRAVMRVIAVESKRNHYPNIKGYVFGPFVPVTDTAKMCGRCGLMIPSEHTGKTMCTSTGWCEACTRIPPYVSHDQLRECLDMRRTDDLLLSPIP